MPKTFTFLNLAIATAMTAMAAPASAQVTIGGPYIVGRIGSLIDSDLKMKGPDTVPPSTFPANVDFRRGKSLEGGLGYDLGGYRLEATVGYTSARANAKRLDTASLVSDGRSKTLSLGLAGYVDVPVEGPLRPFVGGGIDIVRVTERLSRTTRTGGQGSTMNGRDWGFRWHADAGVGYALSDSTTVELAGRYAQTTGLQFAGRMPLANGGTAATSYKPKLTATAITVGLRQRF
ncbi:outer membrane protein [Sphingomonas parapaucimobilis]|uniref:outer membrane protein n=1 Tax=Sphingomonas parapaucimobilis TaxID=28213 RepID=UPI0039EB0013